MIPGVTAQGGVAVTSGGGPGYVAAPRWRVFVTAPLTGSFVAIAQMRLLDALGADLTTGGTPIKSGEYDGSYLASQAFDGNTGGNPWIGTNGQTAGQWLGYEFSSNAVTPTSISLAPGGGYTGYFPQEVIVQYSMDEGFSWVDLQTLTLTTPVSDVYQTFDLDQVDSVPEVPGPEEGTHRYWRAMFLRYGSVPCIGRIEMYETMWGENVLGSGTGSATSSTGGYPASLAFDESLIAFNGWVWAGGGSYEGLIYDFGSGNDKNIQAIGIYTGYVGNGEGGNAPTRLEVQFSDDGATWHTSWVQDSLPWTGKRWARSAHPLTDMTHTGSPYGAHSFWRFLASQNAGGNALSAAEIEFRDEPGGTDQASGGTPFASSYYDAPASTYAPPNAFDGTTTSFWVSNFDGSASIGYEFASPVEVGELMWRARHDTQTDQSPRFGMLQFADSSSGPWTSTIEVFDSTGWATNEERTFADPEFV